MIRNWLIALFVLLGWSGCETEFSTISDWREIPIIYGILDASQPVQYIQINKAFLGERDANEIAQIADSLYFPAEMVVELRAYSFNSSQAANGNLELVDLRDTYQLARVSGADEGLTKPDGLFANDPFFLYKFDQPLRDDRAYEIYFVTPTGIEVSALTSIVSDFRVLDPDPAESFSFFINEQQTSAWPVRWRPATFAVRYDVDIAVNYYEAPINDLDNREPQRIIWSAIDNFDERTTTAGGGFIDEKLLRQRFADFLDARLLPRDGFVRVIESIEHIFTCINDPFDRYIEINSDAGGIAANQVRAEYTNVVNGIGIFGSRYSQTVVLTDFEGAGLDHIACDNESTFDLGFAPSRGQVTWPNCP